MWAAAAIPACRAENEGQALQEFHTGPGSQCSKICVQRWFYFHFSFFSVCMGGYIFTGMHVHVCAGTDMFMGVFLHMYVHVCREQMSASRVIP